MKETTHTTDDGKVIETKEHASGRKDVTIGVKMLDVKEGTEAGKKAKAHIEDVVIPALADQDVLVVVLHKPTNEHAERIVKVSHVRAYAEAVVKAHIGHVEEDYAQVFYTFPELKEFVIIEHNIKNNTVTISTL